MQHSQVSFSEFLPSHQDATEAIHPAMGTLHHPAPSLETGFVPDGLCFLAPCPDMGGKAELFHDLSYLIKVISLVQTKPLWGLCRWLRPVSKNRLQRPPHQFHVCRLAPSMAMPIGMPAASVNRLRLTPCLPRSVGFAPVFLNRPPEPWSLHHPLTTKTSQRPGSRRTASSLRARTSRTRLPLPIPGTVDTPKHRSIFRWHSGHSIGIRCAIQTKCRSARCDPVLVDCGIPRGAPYAAVVRVLSVPINDLESASHHPLSPGLCYLRRWLVLLR